MAMVSAFNTCKSCIKSWRNWKENKCNWKVTNYPSGKDNEKKSEKIFYQLLIMCYIFLKNEYIPLYISKHNSKLEKQVIFNDSKRRMRALYCGKNWSAFLRGIPSKRLGNFYWLNCLHSLEQKTNLHHREYAKIKIFALL